MRQKKQIDRNHAFEVVSASITIGLIQKIDQDIQDGFATSRDDYINRAIDFYYPTLNIKKFL